MHYYPHFDSTAISQKRSSTKCIPREKKSQKSGHLGVNAGLRPTLFDGGTVAEGAGVTTTTTGEGPTTTTATARTTTAADGDRDGDDDGDGDNGITPRDGIVDSPRRSNRASPKLPFRTLLHPALPPYPPHPHALPTHIHRPRRPNSPHPLLPPTLLSYSARNLIRPPALGCQKSRQRTIPVGTKNSGQRRGEGPVETVE